MIDWTDLAVVLDLGFGVFPCRAERASEKQKEKAPLTPHGKDDGTTDRRQIEEWARQYPDCAWGARPPVDINILDIDTKYEVNGFETLAGLERQHGQLPLTLTSHTPSGGEHRVFRAGRAYKNRARVLPGLDVRSTDGYIIVPPSRVLIPPSKRRAPYRWADATQAVAQAPAWLIEDVFAKENTVTTVTSGAIPAGTRNDTLFRYACLLRAKNLPLPEARELLRVRNDRDCAPPVSESELQEVLDNAYKYAAGFASTELGNAQRLIAVHGDDWRWLPELGWCWFDGVRWLQDRERRIGLVAADVVRGILVEALAAADPRQQKELQTWALKSQARRVLEATEALARPYLADAIARYDQQRYLLAVQNGVLDLEHGFREGRREDRLRMAAAVAFDPAATAPLWETFLTEIFAGDTELIGFVQRAMGYSMSGSAAEQVLFIAYGTGANGKTTFINAVRRLMGDYAKAVQPETLMLRDRSGIPNDIARLVGVRFVSTAEFEEGKKFAESLVKQLTGGDAISARFMRQEFFDFVPVMKLWIVTNHKPVITGTDHAIWRRVLLIPFEVKIPEQSRDKQLEEKLLAEAPGILNWMRAGFAEWRHRGLTPPEKVVAATAAYREEMDRVGAFVRECCVLNVNGRTKKPAVYAAYKNWSEASGYVPMGRKRFYDRLRDDHGLATVARHGYEEYDGLLLLDPGNPDM